MVDQARNIFPRDRELLPCVAETASTVLILSDRSMPSVNSFDNNSESFDAKNWSDIKRDSFLYAIASLTKAIRPTVTPSKRS